MTIVDLLERNAREFPNEECLVELNPQIVPEKYKTWREYSLVEPTLASEYRRSITWKEFDETANRFANMLKDKGIVRGNKVAILMNSLIVLQPYCLLQFPYPLTYLRIYLQSHRIPSM